MKSVESILKEKGAEVATITPEASIKRAADWLRAKNVGALVVTTKGAVRGIISERDIVRAFLNGSREGHLRPELNAEWPPSVVGYP